MPNGIVFRRDMFMWFRMNTRSCRTTCMGYCKSHSWKMVIEKPLIPTALYDMIGTFKSLTQNEYADHVRNNGWPPFRKRLWQLRFHDHIIRNETELNRIRRYIIDNPKNWAEDENNPENIRKNHETSQLIVNIKEYQTRSTLPALAFPLN